MRRSVQVSDRKPSHATSHAISQWWRHSVSPLGLLVFLSFGPATPGAAEPMAAEEKSSEQQLDPVDVVAPRPRPPRQQATPAPQPAPLTVPKPARIRAPAPTPAVAPRPVSTPAAAGNGQGNDATTPLNTGAVAESASRLGLTVRQIPASVEVIDQKTLTDRGLHTTTEAAQAATGVTAGDAPGAPASFSMRGFSGTQINTLYNGIKIGPSEMTGRVMDTANLEQIEILKGPASLLSGEGAIGGTVNYVTKQPHTGAVINDAFASFDSFHGFRAGYGSGGSTAVKGLDYRFDITRSNNTSFIEDTYSNLANISGQLNYRVTDNFKVWGAAEYKQDKDRFYWGTPLVPTAFAGPYATSGVVSGLWTQYYPNGHTGTLVPVTIDSRTLTTTYNVLDNHSGAQERWLRGGFAWNLTNNVELKSQVYRYDAQRHWFNNEINAFNDAPATPGFNQVYRERLSVDHDQKLVGNITDLILTGNLAGMDNRFAATFAASSLQFNVVQDDFFNNDFVNLVDPDRGYYGPQQTKNFYSHVDDISLSFEDRLKVTPTFALLGGIRFEEIKLERTAFDVNGVLRSADGYPLSKTFTPTTGRVGYTWEALPGLTLYSQYATAADPAVANIFILRPTQPLLLTTARIYETGVKALVWNKRAEVTFSAFDIERNNVYSAKGGQQVNIAGKVASKGVELSAGVTPIDGLKLWGNVAFVQARYVNFDFIDDNGNPGSFTGKTPPNVPAIVANAGASYRFATRWPIELGASIRHVGDRYNFDDNLVVMNAYTIADAYAFVDIPKSVFTAVDNTRLTFRVRNLTNKLYAAWGDPGYPDQIILGAPRSYEAGASFKF
jgi:iron complex outermembrane receptor protein